MHLLFEDLSKPLRAAYCKAIKKAAGESDSEHVRAIVDIVAEGLSKDKDSWEELDKMIDRVNDAHKECYIRHKFAEIQEWEDIERMIVSIDKVMINVGEFGDFEIDQYIEGGFCPSPLPLITRDMRGRALFVPLFNEELDVLLLGKERRKFFLRACEILQDIPHIHGCFNPRALDFERQGILLLFQLMEWTIGKLSPVDTFRQEARLCAFAKGNIFYPELESNDIYLPTLWAAALSLGDSALEAELEAQWHEPSVSTEMVHLIGAVIMKSGRADLVERFLGWCLKHWNDFDRPLLGFECFHATRQNWVRLLDFLLNDLKALDDEFVYRTLSVRLGIDSHHEDDCDRAFAFYRAGLGDEAERRKLLASHDGLAYYIGLCCLVFEGGKALWNELTEAASREEETFDRCWALGYFLACMDNTPFHSRVARQMLSLYPSDLRIQRLYVWMLGMKPFDNEFYDLWYDFQYGKREKVHESGRRSCVDNFRDCIAISQMQYKALSIESSEFASSLASSLSAGAFKYEREEMHGLLPFAWDYCPLTYSSHVAWVLVMMAFERRELIATVLPLLHYLDEGEEGGWRIAVDLLNPERKRITWCEEDENEQTFAEFEWKQAKKGEGNA